MPADSQRQSDRRPSIFSRFSGSVLGGSYAGGTLRRPESLAALAVVALVSIAVFAFARVPIDEALEIDFRVFDPVGGGVQATLIDFSNFRDFGRMSPGPTARVVLNRPLPQRFELSIIAWWLNGNGMAPLQIELDDESVPIQIGPGKQAHTIAIENRNAARTLTLRFDPGRNLAVQSLTLTPTHGAGAVP
jgi:hypothetical protein